MHNMLFPETYYRLHAFTGFEGHCYTSTSAKANSIFGAYSSNSHRHLCFDREGGEGRYSNAEYTVRDLIPRNVLRDCDGEIFEVDAEIKKKNRVVRDV